MCLSSLADRTLCGCAIGDFGHRVLRHLGVERLALLFERNLGLGVLQQHRGAAQTAKLHGGVIGYELVFAVRCDAACLDGVAGANRPLVGREMDELVAAEAEQDRSLAVRAQEESQRRHAVGFGDPMERIGGGGVPEGELPGFVGREGKSAVAARADRHRACGIGFSGPGGRFDRESVEIEGQNAVDGAGQQLV